MDTVSPGDASSGTNDSLALLRYSRNYLHVLVCPIWVQVGDVMTPTPYDEDIVEANRELEECSPQDAVAKVIALCLLEGKRIGYRAGYEDMKVVSAE